MYSVRESRECAQLQHGTSCHCAQGFEHLYDCCATAYAAAELRVPTAMWHEGGGPYPDGASIHPGDLAAVGHCPIHDRSSTGKSTWLMGNSTWLMGNITWLMGNSDTL